MDELNCVALLDVLPTETLCLDLDGTIKFANRAGLAMLALDDLADAPNFFTLFAEDAEMAREKIRSAAGSSNWLPLSLTLSEGGHKGVRLDLRCRGMLDKDRGVLRVVLVADENRRAVFAEHRRLIRRLNAELAKQQRVHRQLDAALENETRLHQELIHRVKNNLALLSSLIRARTAGTDDDQVKDALSDILARVMSIGMVHELLDQNKQIDIVDAEVLLERLCAQMEDSICPPGVTIKREIEPYKLHVSDATPLALLINELVTNALKHAFTGKDGGVVEIKLKRNGVDKIEVHVVDDGAGFAGNGNGHGSRIIQGLATTLQGELRMNSEGGTSWQLIFAPHDVERSPTA